MEKSETLGEQHLPSFNPHVAQLPTYNAGLNIAVAKAISGRENIARLASNENPDGCSPKVLQALASPAFEPWRYADPACTALREAIAESLGVLPETIVAGNGSEELIAAISRAFLTAGETVVTVVPSFGLHEIEPLATGAHVIKIPMTHSFGFDLPALESALHQKPKILFLSSPWNPVGTVLSLDELARIISALSPETLFVFDEAYVEYKDAKAPDGLKMLQEARVNYISLRTFSKAYGLAGLRVGYAICSAVEIARVVTAAKPPFNVNAAGQLAARAALSDQAWMRRSVKGVRLERERVLQALTELGYRVAPSQTNFVFFDCGEDSSIVASDLVKQGIIVKPWREAGYSTYIRATIGRDIDNDRLIDALRTR